MRPTGGAFATRRAAGSRRSARRRCDAVVVHPRGWSRFTFKSTPAMADDVGMTVRERMLQVATVGRWWTAGHRINPMRLDRGPLKTRWYHDFTPLGLPTPQLPGIYPSNQQSKAPILFEMIEQAVRSAPARPSALEMFCADGFYALHAWRSGASTVRGVDLDEQAIRKARVAAAVLGADGVRFDVCDVWAVDDEVDIGICAGGLYHIADPGGLLAKLRSQVRHALVVQTVIHNGIEDADYFETPAPGWTWGCRFSWAWLLGMVSEAGWTVLDSHRGELAGNDRVEDRGSAFVLCAPS